MLYQFAKIFPCLVAHPRVHLAEPAEHLLKLLEPPILLSDSNLAALCCRALRLDQILLHLFLVLEEEGMIEEVLSMCPCKVGSKLLYSRYRLLSCKTVVGTVSTYDNIPQKFDVLGGQNSLDSNLTSDLAPLLIFLVRVLLEGIGVQALNLRECGKTKRSPIETSR